MNIFPKIKGMTIKNENRAAFVLSIPSKTAVEIVAPDLEIPGNIASAWEIPIIKALFCSTFFMVLVKGEQELQKLIDQVKSGEL